MKTFVICAILLAAMSSLLLQHVAADTPAPRQFIEKIVLTETKDGKPPVVVQPTLLSNDGQEASFLSGGEAAVDARTNDFLEFGVKIRIKVHELAPDKLRVTLYAGNSDLDPPADSNFTIHEQGVYSVKTIKPGEKVDLDFGAGRKVAVTITPFVK